MLVNSLDHNISSVWNTICLTLSMHVMILRLMMVIKLIINDCIYWVTEHFGDEYVASLLLKYDYSIYFYQGSI